jgi:hypothetical protein
MNTTNTTLADYIHQERVRLFLFELWYGYHSTQTPEMFPPSFPPDNEGIWDEQFHGMCLMSAQEALENIPASLIMEHLIMALQATCHMAERTELFSPLPAALRYKSRNTEVVYIQTLITTLIDAQLPQLAHIQLNNLPSFSEQSNTMSVRQYIEMVSHYIHRVLP